MGPKKFGLVPGVPPSPEGGVVMVIAGSCRRRRPGSRPTAGLR